MMDKKPTKTYELPYLDEFLLTIKANNYSPETLYNYERDLATFQKFLAQDIKTPFNAINKRTVGLYKAYLSSSDRKTPQNARGTKQLSSGSINRMLSSLRAYLKYLVDIDYQVPIASEAVKLIKSEKKSMRVEDFSQLVKLIEFPTEFEKDRRVALRNRAMLEVLFSTGVRVSELVSINKEQIDKSGRIFIRGKGKKERLVYLTPRAKKHLTDYLAARSDDNTALFIPYRGGRTGSAGRISPNYVQMKIKQYREILGINIPTTPHSFRRGFATYLAENGANPAAIQILLGHESLHTTSRYIRASDRYAEKTHKQFHPLKE
jgi:site-specific recombinase XerD